MMTAGDRWRATAMVVVGALFISTDWLQRAGIFFLMMALISTIDMQGVRRDH